MLKDPFHISRVLRSGSRQSWANFYSLEWKGYKKKILSKNNNNNKKENKKL